VIEQQVIEQQVIEQQVIEQQECGAAKTATCIPDRFRKAQTVICILRRDSNSPKEEVCDYNSRSI
jgi:hypothetical protein